MAYEYEGNMVNEFDYAEDRRSECNGLLSAEEVAFVQGAKWWEYQCHGATMWGSDQEAAATEARKRKDAGKLGKWPSELGA